MPSTGAAVARSTVLSAARGRGVSATGALASGIAFSAALTLAIWVAAPRLEAIPKLPDQGVSWYFWKLPEPTLLTRATVWTLYALHQVGSWALIWYAQTRVGRYPTGRYTRGLHAVNVAALAFNALFALLHLAQTHLTYDGLAQDVSIFSSQGSVILLLVAVLLMENTRRGLFFGRRAPLPRDAVGLVRRYHGYVFSWAVIYTFWYHPAEATVGHLWGFFYTFLLLLQGSLFFTRAHLNRWWTLALELLVLAHGTLVAVMQGNGLWPMFAFGFGGLFVITQLHGIGLSRPAKVAIVLAYCAAVTWVYAERGWGQLNEVLRIPLIEYAAVFTLAGLLWLILRAVRVFRPVTAPAP